MSRNHDYFVYMATNESRVVLYVGMTNDLLRRISEHRLGEIKGFTERYRVNRRYEYYREVRDTIARETQLKNWSRGKKNALVETLNPKWMDLSFELGLGPIRVPGAAEAVRNSIDPSTSLGTTNRGVM